MRRSACLPSRLGARPRVDGTLAFDRLALDPYLRSGVAPEAAEAAQGSQPLFKYVDADLRISAAEITAPVVALGRGGFTISAKQGVVAGDVGELELCGGSATGRVGLDLSQDRTTATATATISGVPVDDCLKQLALDVPVNGTGGLRAEFSAEGRTYDELAQGVAGSFKVDAQNGAVPVDITRLLTAATPLDGDGWSRNSVTLFDQLNANCRLASGHIWCDTFTMQTSRGVISGSGDVDLGQQTIDWNLFVADHAQPLSASRLSTESPPLISISGALSQPMIRRADRPTLGDGSVQTNPASKPSYRRADATESMTVSSQLDHQVRGMLAVADAIGRRCALAPALAACLSASAGARAEDTLSIATWGGAYGQSQEIAYFEPYAKETGTSISTEIYDGTLAKLKELIGGDAPAVDVVDVSAATLGILCDDGLLEPIEASSLGAAPSGESAEQDFYSGGLSSCGVASVAWSTAIAYRSPSLQQGPARADRRPARHQEVSRQARLARRSTLHARAGAARRRRRSGQRLYRPCHAGRRRSRFQGLG